MCFGTLYLFIIHELAFLPGFISGQSLELCKSRWRSSSRNPYWPETPFDKDKLRLSHLIYRCGICIAVGQEKVLVVEMWFVIAHLLGFEFVPSSSGKAIEAGVECGCKQAVFCQPLLSSRSAACFIHREAQQWKKEITQPISALIFIADENADCKLWFLQSFLAFNPASDLQSALIPTVWSQDNILAKLLITAVQSPKGFKWCIKQCSSICHMWFLLSGISVYGQLCVFLCALERGRWVCACEWERSEVRITCVHLAGHKEVHQVSELQPWPGKDFKLTRCKQQSSRRHLKCLPRWQPDYSAPIGSEPQEHRWGDCACWKRWR